MKRAALAFVLGALTIQAQEYTTTRAPVLISRCTPRYTEEARRAKLEGAVVLYIEVGPDGLAHSIKVTRPLGMGLDESAVEAAKQWRFKPGEKHGEPVTTPVMFDVNFRLNDPSKPCGVPPEEDGKPKNGRG
jgi:TonB family protein